MVFYLYAKNYKKRLNGSKDSNLKIKQFFEILHNFAPIFRGEGVEIEKHGRMGTSESCDVFIWDI